MRVAFLGPAGTYSNQAAVQAFSEFTPVNERSLNDVVNAVVSARADFAVLPVENSTNGPVIPALAALIDADHTKFCIVGEEKVRICHQLYAQTADLAQIHTVYSHPQVWGQTAKWLKTNLPQAKLVSCESTAHAVQLAGTNSQTAALAGPQKTLVPLVCENCADDLNNTTRFLVLQSVANACSPETLNVSANRSFAVVKGMNYNAVLASAKNVKFLYAQPANGAWLYDFFLELTGPVSELWTWLGSVLDPVTAKL